MRTYSTFTIRLPLLLRNGNLWIIIAMTIILTIFYRYWPWQGWANGSFWQYSTFFTNYATIEFKYRFIGSLFYIPILYGTAVFGWRGALLAMVFSLPGLIPLLGVWHELVHIITNVSILLIPFAIASVIAMEVRWHNREKKNFQERERERQLFVQKVIEAQENERRRIAHELHDETIQALSIVASNLEVTASGNTSKEEILRTKDTLNQAIKDLRRMSWDLMPATLEMLGLVSALNLIVNQMNKECAIKTTLTILGEEFKLNPMVEVNIFRMIQEALNNIRRHSKATEAKVILEFADHHVKITMQDNGQGFNLSETMENVMSQNKLGLIGIKERNRLINGTLQIQSSPGNGTSIFVELPC